LSWLYIVSIEFSLPSAINSCSVFELSINSQKSTIFLYKVKKFLRPAPYRLTIVSVGILCPLPKPFVLLVLSLTPYCPATKRLNKLSTPFSWQQNIEKRNFYLPMLSQKQTAIINKVGNFSRNITN
jgi:hypothetical protein